MSSDIFLKLDGVEGESQAEKHKGEIEILSYSWGISQTATGGAGGGGGAGKVQFQDFHFTSRLQKSSPVLFLKCATGQHLKEGIITVRKSGGQQQDFYKITLSDVLVTGLSQSHSEGGEEEVPIESISLNFAKFRQDYYLQNADGQIGQPISAEWDLKKNKGG